MKKLPTHCHQIVTIELDATVDRRRTSVGLVSYQIAFVAILASTLSISPVLGRQTAQSATEETVNFSRDIRPIFNAHCSSCHGGVKQLGDVSFVYRDQVVAPDGFVVEPGDPEESALIQRVLSDDPDDRMPPPDHGPALIKHEVGLLTRWIEQGAKWDQHWAYELPHKPSIPSVAEKSWPRQSIDAFVLASLEARGIAPAQDAEHLRWLRRVTLDLTGIPPSIEEQERFQKEINQAERLTPAAIDRVYANIVDGLLGSPHYGEKWASAWLDQVRYADSKGLGADAKRNIWKFRDWVIDAINEDMPFDEFTIKQIAGDLRPNPSIGDFIATANQRLTQSNEEGGTDDEEFRVAAVLDRVNTTWQTWQGVTFGCVQCHSHPYDPFRHDEYYKFAAFFNNTADSDLNQDWPIVNAPLDNAQYERASALDREIVSLNHQIWSTEYDLLNDPDNWQTLRKLTAKTNNATKVTIDSQPDYDEYHTVDTVSNGTDIILESPLSGVNKLTAIRLTALPLDPEKAKADSEWGFVFSHITASLIVPGQDQPQEIEFARLVVDEPEPFLNPQESFNSKTNRGFAAYTRIHQARQGALLLREPLNVPKGTILRLTLKHRIFMVGAFPMVARRGHLAVSQDEKFIALQSDESLVKLRQTLAGLRQQRAGIKSTSVPVLKERPNHLSRPTHVFNRGLFLDKGQEVTAGTPKSFPPLPEGKVDRLTLARWLVGPENPLTARVAVNRIWARLFGTGIVASEEDFGSSGEAPSHPKLLDHLAIKFRTELDWSQKNLIRELVLSRTYRQSSAIRADQHSQDRFNRWLARGPRFRLSAEMVRDQALFVSGLLSAKQFGPPVHPPIPAGVWNPFSGGDKWNTPKPDSEDRYRRSIYTYTKRSIPYPMFAAFDAPSREVCAPRRLRSNTPIQALTLLNDQTLTECTAALAKRMIDKADTPRDQVQFGFKLVTCREPNEVELEALLSLLESSSEQGISAMKDVATVLLNLDEALTK